MEQEHSVSGPDRNRFKEVSPKAFSAVFLAIIFAPLILGLISKVTASPCDVALLGYTDNVSKPAFSTETFFSGDFQTNFNAWFESALKPRGVLIKTYSTIRYHLFNLGNRIIGYHKDIFESAYINAELSLQNQYDFSRPENQAALKKYVRSLEALNDKLRRRDKALYLYVAPSKANFDYDNVPRKYKALAPSDAVTAVEYFSQLLADTDIPHLICRDMKDELEYPAFYPTGIHWSRTFGQTASQRIMEDLSALTGKNYKGIRLGPVKESSQPFGSDADVYDLLNVWNLPDNIRYYEYEFMDDAEARDKMRIMIQGDSFSKGLYVDILNADCSEDIYHFERNIAQKDAAGKVTRLTSWETSDALSLLDDMDALVLEMTEPEIIRSSWGFVDYLNQSLNYLRALDFDDPDTRINFERSGEGFYRLERGSVWTKKDCALTLENPEIAVKGLEIVLAISPQIIRLNRSQSLEILVNGKRMYQNVFSSPQFVTLTFTPEELKDAANEEAIWKIEFHTDGSFVPKEIGQNADTRELSLDMRYVGSVR